MDRNPHIRLISAAHSAVNHNPKRRKRRSRRRDATGQHVPPASRARGTIPDSRALTPASKHKRFQLNRRQRILAFASLAALLTLWNAGSDFNASLVDLNTRVEHIEETQQYAMVELENVKNVSHRVDVLFNRVLELRTTSEELGQEIREISYRLPADRDLSHLPEELDYIHRQLNEVEGQISGLGKNGNLETLQQLVQTMHKRITVLNRDTESLIRYVAESTEAPWSDQFLLSMGGRGGASSETADDDAWSINLPPIGDRLAAEKLARTIGKEGLLVDMTNGNSEYLLRVSGFKNAEHARNYLLKNLARKAFDGAWLSKMP